MIHFICIKSIIFILINYRKWRNYVSELEFVKALISLLSENDKRNVIKQASARGFEVQGFSNKPYNAPPNIINRSLVRKNKKNISNYYLVLDVINKFQLSQAENKDLFILAQEWINNDEKRSVIEDKLGLLSQGVITRQELTGITGLTSIADKSRQESSVHEEALQNLVAELEEKNDALHKKNKELKEKIKSSKIELDNLRKDLNICQKEKKKQTAEAEKLQIITDEYQQKQKELETQLQESREYTAGLLSQIEVLKHYKNNALKVACFISGGKEPWLEGYNITFFNEWNDSIRESTDTSRYSEVWYVHKGFNYSCFMEIKACFKCRIKEYMTVEKLMSEV